MSVVICPGIHDPCLTQSLLAHLAGVSDYILFPAELYPPYSAPHLLNFLRRQFSNPLKSDRSLQSVSHVPLVFLAFSAGVVGAIGAAWGWRTVGGQVKAFIAVDGWGVPLLGDFPIYRLSHDAFTHWTSALLGPGEESFYAEPPVSHHSLWRSPHEAIGYHVHHSSPASVPQRTPTTAADFILAVLARHHEQDEILHRSL